MRIGVKWPVLVLAICAVVNAVQAAEDPPRGDNAQEPARQTDAVVKVIVDFARPFILDRPASTVIIGNPAIAQATLSDDKTVILTGKTPGSTNLIVMDADGAEVANVVLDVVAAGGRLITVHQGNGRATYSCSERCDPVQTGEESPTSSSPQTTENGNATDAGGP